MMPRSSAFFWLLWRRIFDYFFLSLLISRTQFVIKKSSNDNFFCSKQKSLSQIIIIWVKTFFEHSKSAFNDFLMLTWDREKESERKMEPQIPCLCRKFRINIQDDEGLNYHQEAAFGANTTPGTKEVHESHELFNECPYTLWPLDRIEIREFHEIIIGLRRQHLGLTTLKELRRLKATHFLMGVSNEAESI